MKGLRKGWNANHGYQPRLKTPKVRSRRIPRRDEYSLSFSTSLGVSSTFALPPRYSTTLGNSSSFAYSQVYLSFSTDLVLQNRLTMSFSDVLYNIQDAARSAPMSFAQSPLGDLFMATGLGPVLTWDGFSKSLATVGVASPTVAMALSSSGLGNIVGTYTAYVRFIDSLGNPSNLSPVSDTLTVNEATGTITAVSATSPIVVTSVGHGLFTGLVVQIDGVVGVAAANGSFSITVIDSDTFTLVGTSGQGTYTSGGTWSSGAGTITYASVQAAPTGVARRQILRNTSGQASTYYVDIDTFDVSSTTLTSTRTDSNLLTQEAVPLFDTSGKPFANRFGVPPSWKSVLANHQGRMFLAGEVEYNDGSAALTFGSRFVQGIGTEWNQNFSGRFLYIVGADQGYEISAVNAATQVISLVNAYLGPTDPYAVYSIRPAPAERRLIYYSEADTTQAWPAVNAVELNEDGDEMTGLLSKGSFLYILERRHIYRLTFQSSPAEDGGIFLTSNRGCVNHRCWVSVEDQTYMLDEFGIHAFSGGSASEPTSLLIMDLFRPSAFGLHINWSQSKWFHASHFPAQETIRWFLTLSGDGLPRQALCYAYRHQRWWVEEYPFAISSSAVMLLDFSRTIVGGDARKVFALWGGALDVVDASLGTVRGTVTSAGVASLTDTAATFPTSRILNAPCCITAGTGKGQLRRVSSVSGSTLNLDQPWLVRPDATSTYQIGGVPWQWQSGWFRYDTSTNEDGDNVRRVEVLYEPVAHAATFDIAVLQDWAQTPIAFGLSISSADNSGIQVSQGGSALTADLTKSIGFVQQRMDTQQETFTEGQRFVSIVLSGVSGQDPVLIYGLALEGVKQI